MRFTDFSQDVPFSSYYIIKLKFCFIKIYTPLENSILFNNKIAQSQHFGIIESLQTTIKNMFML